MNACFWSSFPYFHKIRAELSEIIFYKNHTPEDEKDGNGEIWCKKTNQINIKPAWNFVAKLEKVFLCKNLSSIDPVLGSSPSPTGHASILLL